MGYTIISNSNWIRNQYLTTDMCVKQERKVQSGSEWKPYATIRNGLQAKTRSITSTNLQWSKSGSETKKKMWRKRGSAKSNPRNSERCKSETARKHQNASKIQITRTQKKNTYRYEIWDQNPRKLPNLQDSPRNGIFFFCGQETRMLEWRRESKFIIVATNSLGICHCFFRKSRPYHEDLPWMRPSPIDGWSYWNTLSFFER